MIGNLVKITRRHTTKSFYHYGVVLGYLPIDDSGPFKKPAKIKINLLLPSGELCDLYMMDDDVLEVISEGG